jgi:hypothetical protein
MLGELERILKEHGVEIITPQDKLNSYIEGLKLVRGNPVAEAGQWDTIGYEYNRMNQRELAKEAYQCAISALQKIDISQEKCLCDEEKLQYKKEIAQWKRELLEKMKNFE